MKANNKMQGGSMKNSLAQRRSRTNLPAEVRCARRPHSAFLKRVILPLRWLSGSFALFLVFASTAQAGRYELEKGKGVEVCEAYEKNLNSFKPRAPFRCDRPISPEFKDFTKPVFKGPESLPVDRVVPGAVIRKVERFLWERDVNPVYYFPVTEWPKWKGTKEQYDQAWRKYNYNRESNYMNRWKIAEVDIDNDGTPETVYRDGQCPSGALLLVVNKDMTDIDRAKTELVMPHPSRKAQGLGEFRPLEKDAPDYHPDKKFGRTWVEDSLHGAGYDVFRYKNKTYFDLWWFDHPDYQSKSDIEVGKPLSVFVIDNKQTREICTYRYRDAN